MRWTAVFMFALFIPMLAHSQTLEILTLQMPPVEYEEDGKIQGIAVDLVREAFKRMNVPIRIRLYPFARAMEIMANGNADAVFAVVKNTDRETFLDFPTIPLVEETAVLVVRSDSPIQFSGDFSTLGSFTFGILRGARYGNKFDSALQSGIISKVEEVSDYGQNVAKLASRRIDIMIGPQLSLLYAIHKAGLKGLMKELAPAIQAVPTYLAFSKIRVPQAVQKKFEAVLKELKQDGTYEAILHSYGY